MAGFRTTTTAESKGDKKAPDDLLSFIEYMRLVFGCEYNACNFTINGFCDNGFDWLSKYHVSEQTGPISGIDDTLIADLMLPDIPLKGITIEKGGIHYDLKKQQSDPKKMIFAAFALATTAKAHPEIRAKGAKLDGDKTEQALLFLAAAMAGITVNKEQAQAVENNAKILAADLKQKGYVLEDLWQEFCKTMDDLDEPKQTSLNNDADNLPGDQPDESEASSGPDLDREMEDASNFVEKEIEKAFKKDPVSGKSRASTETECLSGIFKRTNLPDGDAKDILKGSKIAKRHGYDTAFEAYQTFTESVVKGQDARKPALIDIFKKLKSDFNVTNDDRDDMIRAMDAEGLTEVSNKDGRRKRIVLCDHDGRPKSEIS